MARLFLVATPIGNLEDVTLRALRVLREVSLVAAEDTRTARKLLSHYGISQPLVSYNEHNMRARTPRILAALESADVALVSEAGTPGVRDPGYELAAAALDAGHEVVPVPGPSAVIAALSASGLPMGEFTFLGFLPRRSIERCRLFESLRDEGRTLVAFESPHRVRGALEDALATLGDRRIAVCRELTKAFEEVFRGTISEALEHFQGPRGEFTLVIEGWSQVGNLTPRTEEEAGRKVDEARRELAELRANGAKGKEAVRQVSERTGLPHREVYRLWLETGAPRPRSG